MPISRLRFALLYTLICLIWGSTWVVIRIGEQAALDPFLGVTLRFMIATIILWVIVFARHSPMPKGKTEWIAVIVNGAIGTATSYAIVYWSSQFVPSGLEAVIFGTMPLWTIIIAHFALKSEPLTGRRLIGVLLGFGGLLVVFLPTVAQTGVGAVVPMIVMLGSPFVSAINLIVTKRYAKRIDPVSLNALSIGIATPILATFALATNDLTQLHFTSTQLWTVGYLAIFGTIVTFLTYYYLLRITPAIHMSYVTIVTPVIAVFLGWLLLGEKLSAYALAGAVIVLVGIWMTVVEGPTTRKA
jgi:drug/metabolite transporter (DMT)-like permease